MPIWSYSNPPDAPPSSLRGLAAVGRCIYCASVDNLTTEHVVPAGMRGRVTLPQATCEPCRIITHEIETRCMRHTLLHARIEHGLHKHPHESPVTFPIEFTDWNDHKTIQHISLADCPLLTIMPVYEYPGILRDIPADETNFGIISANHSDDADDLFKKLLQRDGVKSVEVKSGGIDTWIFSRWLAKISYSFSVACLGYDNICHSPLAEIVRQHTLHFGHLIGGVNDLCLPSQDFKLEPPVDAFFNIELTDYATDDGKIFWATRIRLMPILKTPTYFLVVGERR